MSLFIILWFGILLFFSAFFSASEIAIMSLPSHTVDALVKKKRLWSLTLQKLKQNTDSLLITILIGNNLVNTLMASLAAKFAIEIANVSWYQQSLAIGVSTAVITLFILTFWEIFPKSFGVKHATKLALYFAYPLKFFVFILTPVVYIFELITKRFTGKHIKIRMSDEEMESFIDLGKVNGALDAGEHERIKWILELWDIVAENIMTPRVNIRALADTTTLENALTFFMANNYSRIPVYLWTVDSIQWFVTLRDIIAADPKKNSQKHLGGIFIHQMLKIPLNQPLDTLFKLFQNNQKHIAVVVDEYGWVAGLITLEDIFEEVFGEIRDETDIEIDDIQKMEWGTYIIDSSVMIDDILEKFDLELDHIGLDVAEFSTETVSFILTDTLERFPEVGEIIEFTVSKPSLVTPQVLSFHIVDMIDMKIGKIEVSLQESDIEEISEED